MRHRKYDIRKEHLEQMRAAGMGRISIAKVYGCEESTITHWLRKYGLPTSLQSPLETVTDADIMRGIERYRVAFVDRPHFKKLVSH